MLRLRVESVVLPSRIATEPVGTAPVPVTVAPIEIDVPMIAAAGEAVRTTLGVSRLMVTVCAEEVTATKLLSPL